MLKRITTAVPKTLRLEHAHPTVGNPSRSRTVQVPSNQATRMAAAAAQEASGPRTTSSSHEPRKTDVDGWGEWRRRCAQELEGLRDQMLEAAAVVSSGGAGQEQGGRRLG